MSKEVEKLVQACREKEPATAKAAFAAAIKDKLQAALADKKVEVASNLFNNPTDEK